MQQNAATLPHPSSQPAMQWRTAPQAPSAQTAAPQKVVPSQAPSPYRAAYRLASVLKVLGLLSLICAALAILAGFAGSVIVAFLAPNLSTGLGYLFAVLVAGACALSGVIMQGLGDMAKAVTDASSAIASRSKALEQRNRIQA